MIKESINQEAMKNPKQSLLNVTSLKYMKLEIQGEIDSTIVAEDFDAHLPINEKKNK